MTRKGIVRLKSARADERDAVAYYAAEAGLDLALDFTEALRDAYRFIEEHPGLGSPRYGDLLGLRGLRSRRVGRFPYLVFYIEQPDRIDIWRVLHAQRDIPATLGEADT